MKTTFDAEKEFYKILNVAGVTGNIDGAVYRSSRPINSEKQDVVIVPLGINGEFVQEGFMNINIYAKDLSDSTPDISKLETITKAVISTLNAFAGTAVYFDFIPTTQGVIKDEKGWSYVNLRVNYFIES